MGDYSELYFSGVKTPPGRGELSDTSPYLLSKYHVPLFWLAMFDGEDIADRRESEEPDDVWPYLAKKRAQAIAMLDTRRPRLISHFPGMDPVWLNQFASMLARTPFEYVHLDTSQIGGMVGTGPEWRQSLETMLGIFEVEPPPPVRQRSFIGRLFRTANEPPPPPSWRLFNASFGGSYTGTRGTQPWPYCGGSGTDEAMPWELPP
ncbi:hypothetical protein [Variovorax sp. PAMC26660]|uniref:hypothetical protein n=1 Tax=Variovorax sp. PAMC26660 TaxID=2762322 RepID=UPI00164DE260|nr:hypothetical protein [Variovorax sp. PAMC26660]QNK68965.1 hypothetical protein H7F35_04360 [Variovorax sp. PAMC26660]